MTENYEEDLKYLREKRDRTTRQIELLEDAMMIYEMERATIRKVFYIDTGDTPTEITTAALLKNIGNNDSI